MPSAQPRRLVSLAILWLVVLFAMTPGAARAAVRYVDHTAGAGADNGTSWGDAFTSLQSALAAAAAFDEIWVAAGSYKPSSTGNRASSFVLINDVAVFGGFAGAETMLSQRNPDPATNGTVLTGDLNGDDGPAFANRTDNSYHVVDALAVNGTAILDGFTVSGGHADGPLNADQVGGGIRNRFNCSPTLHNLMVSDNFATIDGGGIYNVSDCDPDIRDVVIANNEAMFGGGIYNRDSRPFLRRVTFTGNESTLNGGAVYNLTGSNATFIDVVFLMNTALEAGGAVYCASSSPTFVNVSFLGNISTTGGGGGVHNTSASNPLFVNALFSGNDALLFGGAMANLQSSVPTLINATFSENSATIINKGGAIHGILTAGAIVKNSVLWGNTAAGVASQVTGDPLNPASSNNLIEGDPGAADPLFADADGADNISGTLDDDLTLLAGSPAIDAGDNSFLPADTADLDADTDITEAIPLDFGDLPRRQFGNTGIAALPAVDLGAHEFVVAGAPGSLDNDSDGLPNDYEFFHTGSFTALSPLADDEGDGIPALAEFYFNLDLGVLDSQLLPDNGVEVIGPYLTLSHRHNRFAAPFATCTIERSINLVSWFTGQTVVVLVAPIDADTDLVTVRSLFPMGPGNTIEFLRTVISP